VTHELLHGTNVVATLEQVRREAMTQRVWTDRLIYADAARGPTDRALH
jgi:hypothetical protein